jgi:transcriptional regulator with XRE-family HTH domain
MAYGEARTRLADMLRTARLDAGLSGEELARRLGWSQSKVSKMETGRTRAAQDDVAAWLGEVGTAPELRTQAEGLARDAQGEARHWRDAYRDGAAALQRELVDLGARPQTIRAYQHNVVPGLLQTAEYAKAVFAGALRGTEFTGKQEIAEAVQGRLERQQVLYDSETTARFVVTEAALRWRPDEGRTLAVQLDRMMAMASLNSVELAVIPLDRPGPLLPVTSFTMFDQADDPVVLVETVTRELVITEPGEVDFFRDRFSSAEEQTLSGEDSLAFIRDLWSALVR